MKNRKAILKINVSLTVKYGWKGMLRPAGNCAGLDDPIECNKIKCTKINPVIIKGNK